MPPDPPSARRSRGTPAPASITASGLDTGARDERPRLHGGDRRRALDDVASYEAKGDLRRHEPRPVDPGVQRGIDDAERGPEESGPQQRAEQTAPKKVTPRAMRPTTKARPSKARRVVTSASAIRGIAMAARRFSGYHTLCWTTMP